MANTGLQNTQEPWSVSTNGPEGCLIGKSSTEKVGFYGNTPVARPSSAGNTTGFIAGAGTASKADSVWAGASGSTAYTVGDIVTILKSLGILAA